MSMRKLPVKAIQDIATHLHRFKQLIMIIIGRQEHQVRVLALEVVVILVGDQFLSSLLYR